eukprot:Opistho-1_new@85360
MLNPRAVSEHQDIGPGQRAAARAKRQLFAPPPTRGGIDLGQHAGGVPHEIGAGAGALEPVDGAVALEHVLLGEAGALELAVDVAGEDEGAPRQPLGPPAQDREAVMRNGLPVQRQAVTIEAPGEPRVGAERAGRGDLGEVHRGPAQCRIGLPAAGVAAEVRQAAVDAHAGAGGNDERIRLRQVCGCPVDVLGSHRGIVRRRCASPNGGSATSSARRPAVRCARDTVVSDDGRSDDSNDNGNDSDGSAASARAGIDQETATVLTVHHLNNSRSHRIVWLCEELGIEYRLVKHQRHPETQRSPESLNQVHPLGKAPTIEHAGQLIVES